MRTFFFSQKTYSRCHLQMSIVKFYRRDFILPHQFYHRNLFVVSDDLMTIFFASESKKIGTPYGNLMARSRLFRDMIQLKSIFHSQQIPEQNKLN